MKSSRKNSSLPATSKNFSRTKIANVAFVAAALPLLLLASCACGPVTFTKKPGDVHLPAQWISAADARFRYEGRMDFSDRHAPVIIWQASRIRLDFDGDTLTLLFDNVEGQCFFNAQLDDATTIIELREGVPARPVPLTVSGTGRHQLILFKRSEASAGTVSFHGVKIAAGAHASAPVAPDYKLTMEFIGDSITAGACNEDGDVDQWDNRRTHNSALSYAAFTAAAFSSDYRNIAVSGMGVATGWVEVKAGAIWDRLYPNSTSARADLSAWTPQVVFVNLGENDDSYPRAHGRPFPAGYTSKYVSLVQAVRKTYPDAHIVLLRGGMYGGARSKELRSAWEAAVTRLESIDPSISHFVFEHWTHNHPRVADDRAMADELIAWLKRQSFMPSRFK